MSWRAVLTDDGSWTLAHPRHGQTLHSSSGAWQQALERYARPCRLRERALEPGREQLDLLDIGTGLGLNLAAALSELAGTGVRLRALSLEREAEVLVEGLRLSHTLPGGAAERAEPWHACVRSALELVLADPGRAARPAGLPLGDGGSLGTLRVFIGDARSTLRAGPALEADLFDAVFLDPFSPRVEPELWEPEFLALVAARMRPGSWLSTYTVSMPVRRALARAGLRVGPGPAVGHKRAGTLASPDLDPGELDARSRRRLRPSSDSRPPR